MRRKRRVGGIALIIAALLIMQLPVGTAEAAASGGFTIEGTKVVSYRGTEENVSVPNGVESIGSSVFEDDLSIKRVIFPKTLRRIGEYAFWGCDNLTEISFGAGLKEVSDYAFTNCKGLQQVVLPSNITSIGIGAFEECVNLTDITIPPNVTFIHETAFDGCKNLIIHCPEGSYASKYAKDFYKRQSEMAEYEDVPTYEPEEEKDPAELPDIYQPEDNTGLIGSTSVVGNQAVFLLNNQVPTVYQGIIPQEEQITPAGPVKYRIVDQTIVADQAYYRDAQLESIVLPEGIKAIGEFAFARSGAGAAALPEGLETIGYGAFYHCDSLAAVKLPESIRKIEPKAFEHTPWVDRFLAVIDQTQGDFLISGGALVAYRGMGGDIVIPENVRVIAAGCFAENADIKSVALPAGLKVIGEEAFLDCKALETIHLQEGLEEINDRAFAGCNLKEVQLPGSVIGVGLGAFDQDVTITYVGAKPGDTYESSAQRLSNRDYRFPEGEQAGVPGAGILVLGMPGASASWKVTGGEYTLRINPETEEWALSQAKAALTRGLGATPEGVLAYQMTLTDGSKVPITKLGKQKLQVTIPIPAEMANQGLELYMYDANGQLDRLDVTYSRQGEMRFFTFDTSRVSSILVVPNGRAVQREEVLEYVQPQNVETVQMENLSAPAVKNAQSGEVTTLMILKWAGGGLLLLVGLFLALTKVK